MPAGSKISIRPLSQSIVSMPIRTPQKNTGMINQCRNSLDLLANQATMIALT